MRKNSAGFTLIELLIAMGMVAILAGTALRIAKFSTTHKNLTIATDQLRSAIRQAQSFSLSIPNVGSSDHMCGFGLLVEDANNYVIFYNSQAVYEDCENLAVSKMNGAASTELDAYRYLLPEGVTFAGADIGKNVFFMSPYGDIHDGTGTRLVTAGGYNTVSFTLSGPDGTTKTIVVSSFGNIN